MTDRTASRLAWGGYALSMSLVVVGVVIGLTSGGPGIEDPDAGLDIVLSTTIGLAGALVASRRRDNPLGWLLLFLSAVTAVTLICGTLAGVLALEGRVGDARWFAWVWNWITALIFPAGALMWVILLFPDGRLPGPRWRWVLVGGAVYSITSAVLFAIEDHPLELSVVDDTSGAIPTIPSPVGLIHLPDYFEFVWLLGVVFALASVVGVILRLRRSKGRERQQLKWFAYVMATTFGALVTLIVVGLIIGDEHIPEAAWSLIIITGFGIGVPAALAIAIFGHGLYEIDVVIRKTVVYALFAAFATAVYAAIVVGVGAWVGRDNSFLTMAAAVFVAVTFQPVRQRLTRLADRLVYGKRATPYEVLSEFAERVGETYATTDLLPRMATVLGEGTGASRATVWMKVGDELRATATYPSDATRPEPVAVPEGELPPLPDADVAYPVRHQGELLGAIALVKPASDPLTPTDEKLVSDLAAQAGLVLRNAGLTTELQARIEELRALQKRLVSAQDQERRRLERNIHDGAQQQLVALAVKARLVRGLAEKDPATAVDLAVQLESETQDALENLRDLARGIYPPLLADKGLAAALESQARKSPVPVSLATEAIDRYPQEVEAAAYFCVLEALQNIAKYAQASTATVRLARENGLLLFEVADDGVGFDPDAARGGTGIQGMADRLAALDGTLDVRSAPGAGATVIGTIPVAEVRT